MLGRIKDVDSASDECNLKRKNFRRKENSRRSHVKISVESESVKNEPEPTTSTQAVPPTIKIIGKEVSYAG